MFAICKLTKRTTSLTQKSLWARKISVTQPATQDDVRQVVRKKRPEKPKPGDTLQVKYHNTDSVDGLYEKCRKPLDRFDPTKRAWHYMLVGTSAAIGVTGGRMYLYRFMQSWSAAKDVLAQGTTEADVTQILPGTTATIKWRGSPVFVSHRTPASIAAAENCDWEALRDPESDDERVKQKEWLVMMAVCTHFGCVPLAGQGDFAVGGGGYFCPCHGSHYDTSGRIRKGPAPSNLPVPTYSFPAEGTLLIG